MTRIPLTGRQRLVFEFIRDYIAQHNVAPTFDEMSKHFGRTLGTLHEMVEILEQKGWIRRDGDARSRRNMAIAVDDDEPMFVLHRRDADPWEVLPFAASQRADAMALFEKLSTNWTETYLVRVDRGPRDTLERLRR